MQRFGIAIVALLSVLALGPSVYAQPVSNADPCMDYAERTAGLDISSATDTSLVPLVANTAIYVCAVHVNQAGGVGTVYLESATAASCGGTLAQLTGKWTANTTAGTTTDSTWGNFSRTAALVPTGSGLCVKSTGTIVQSVTVSYVQK